MKKVIDYVFKAEVLNTDIPKLANQISKAIYARFVLEAWGEIIKTNMDYDTAMKTRCFLLEKFPKEYEEAEKINLARYKRVCRLRKRISVILTEYEFVQFVTFTFTDETLKNTNAKTRRCYVQRFLKNMNCDYVANIDFGKKNGREHYHAVVGGICDKKQWEKYGFMDCEWVKLEDVECRTVPKRYRDLPADEIKQLMKADNEKRLSKYVAKLTNHAIKETARRSAIMYSKIKILQKQKEQKKLNLIEENTDLPPFDLYEMALEYSRKKAENV